MTEEQPNPENVVASEPPANELAAPLVMHIVYRFDVGGLENGIVNLINRLPRDEFRHAVVALSACEHKFQQRIKRDDIEFISLHKPAGHSWKIFREVVRLFRDRRPAIVHTRNLAALELQCPAWAARVPVRIHGEHGRDVADPDGSNVKHQLVRRAYSPFVTHYVTVSRDLEEYLHRRVGIARRRISRICNGVDEDRFRPAPEGMRHQGTEAARSTRSSRFVVGCVGRLQEIKDHRTLLASIDLLLQRSPELRGSITVQVIGHGPLREVLDEDVRNRGLHDVVEFLGERHDVAECMRNFDLFVLPSLGEGISNTVLEAMASGLPVVATAVGGNLELITPGETGQLVPPANAGELAAAIGQYISSGDLRKIQGARARNDVEDRFSLTAMVERYRALYARSIARGGAAATRPSSELS